MSAITGELSIDLGSATLTARTDVELARKWAAYEHGPDAWQAMSFGQQSAEIADALHALREAYEAGQ